MNVQDIRTYVRDTLDVDAEDMPDRLIDAWMHEGYVRVHRLARRWPHFETEAVLATEGGRAEYDLSLAPFGGLREITFILGPDGPLRLVSVDEAERLYFWQGVPLTRRPEAFSTWGTTLRLWPTPDTAYSLAVRGYRLPAAWPAASAADSPDLPDDFGIVIRAWVMHKAYLHQDDPDLAQVSKMEFDEGLAELADSELQMPSNTPMVVGGARKGNGIPYRLRFPWE